MKRSNKILLNEKEKCKTRKADDDEEDPVVNASDYALIVKNLPQITIKAYDYDDLTPNLQKAIAKGRKCKKIRKDVYETPDFTKRKLKEAEVLRAELVCFFEERYGTGIVEGVNQILVTEDISEKVKLIKQMNGKIKEKEILINKQRFALENYEKFKIRPTSEADLSNFEEAISKFVEKRSRNWLKRILCCLFFKSNQIILKFTNDLLHSEAVTKQDLKEQIQEMRDELKENQNNKIYNKVAIVIFKTPRSNIHPNLHLLLHSYFI